MTGHVKYFNVAKYFGFIIPEGRSQDRDSHVFFYGEVVEDGRTLSVGQEVEYSLIPGYPTPRALWVKLVSKRAYVPINQQQAKRALA